MQELLFLIDLEEVKDAPKHVKTVLNHLQTITKGLCFFLRRRSLLLCSRAPFRGTVCYECLQVPHLFAEKVTWSKVGLVHLFVGSSMRFARTS